MKLYLIKQDKHKGYDTYDSAVVCAEDEDAARKTYPRSEYIPNGWPCVTKDVWTDGWVADWHDVIAIYLGEAEPDRKAGVICASYHAG